MATNIKPNVSLLIFPEGKSIKDSRQKLGFDGQGGMASPVRR